MATTKPAVPHAYGTGAVNYGQHSLLATLDSVSPDVATKLYRRQGNALEVLNLLFAQGSKSVITNSDGGSHFEEERDGGKITLASYSITSGILTVTTTESQEIDNLNAKYYSFVKVGDLVVDVVNNVRGRVLTKTNSSGTFTYTIRPLNGTAFVAAGAPTQPASLAVYSTSHGEDTGQPEADGSFWTKETFKLQRHKSSAKITGDAMTDKLEFVLDADGKTIAGLHTLLFAKHEYKHLKGLVGAQFYGVETTNNSGISDDVMPSTTKGMIQAFDDRAVNEVWSAAGVGDTDLSDFYSLIAGMKANYTGNFLTALMSKNLYEATEKGLMKQVGSIANESVRKESARVIFGDNSDFETLMATFAFTSITLNGKSMSFKSLDMSYDPTLYGSDAASKFSDYGFVYPSEKVTDAQNIIRSCVELRYKSMGGENRFMKMWDDGAASPRQLGPDDNWKVYMLTHFGFDYFELEQCGFFTK